MSTPPSNKTGIERAIEFVGTQSKLAKLIGAKQQMVSYWKRAGIVGDAAMCAAIERATNGEVRCEELNPHLDWPTLRAVLCDPHRPDPIAEDSAQPPAGTSSRKIKERHIDARAA